MVINPSAILAIMYAEPEESTFLDLIASDEICLLSAPGYVELSIVLGTRYGEEGRESFDKLLQELSITIVPFSPEQARFAAEAFFKFGKGRHPAKLNMGDCFSSGLVKAMNQPLLFKGNDFIQTDIERVNTHID
ncbi:type II toxin-antitoxin system VapC family toxin [Roseofilum reptotaenium CS-1145]|uniref:VapC toxin family PIN domain ribonuclease n=1 Tax=Roseofilum reptotaenium AO1-A TaxID=1925591 RepID=A0A1L9QTD4_9CYAN|nr:type II toxin-antitoxin system VapC family toxin [Roseofilum reptotaenium]MDB9518943.1 type II toxin-antitoxin system VapC family toxin [Roseofilum reptotaenium CS-1145]OJJ25950.1 VapC toxin family PIN domain ribonuclease [Roseofilum reptotaenium AO1-A]